MARRRDDRPLGMRDRRREATRPVAIIDRVIVLLAFVITVAVIVRLLLR